jgi:hypothetical protein
MEKVQKPSNSEGDNWRRLETEHASQMRLHGAVLRHMGEFKIYIYNSIIPCFWKMRYEGM